MLSNGLNILRVRVMKKYIWLLVFVYRSHGLKNVSMTIDVGYLQ